MNLYWYKKIEVEKLSPKYIGFQLHNTQGNTPIIDKTININSYTVL